jgi:hypothetical protein
MPGDSGSSVGPATVHVANRVAPSTARLSRPRGLPGLTCVIRLDCRVLAGEVNMSASDRFVYYGSASILSGHLHQPGAIDLNLGASALPLEGGQSRHRVGSQRFGEVLAFESAETRAVGAPRDRAESARGGRPAANAAPAQAVVGVAVRGLTIASRPALSVKHVEAVLTAECASASKEPSMRTLDEARFEGVAFDEYRLSVSINRAFFKAHDTLTKLTAATKLAAASTATGRTRSGRAPLLGASGRPEAGSAAPMLTTIVKSLRWLEKPFPGSTIDGHVVSIPGLGRVFFGEMFVSGPTRRLTMLRFELNGDIVFDGACCEVETGGNWRH